MIFGTVADTWIVSKTENLVFCFPMLAWGLFNLLSVGDPGIAVPPGIAGALFQKKTKW